LAAGQENRPDGTCKEDVVGSIPTPGSRKGLDRGYAAWRAQELLGVRAAIARAAEEGSGFFGRKAVNLGWGLGADGDRQPRIAVTELDFPHLPGRRTRT
jgi:hypothetical protein